MRLLDWLSRGPRPQPSLGVAAIALAAPQLPAKHVLARRLREALPLLPPLRDAETHGDMLSFTLGDARVSLALLRTPLPSRQRERLQVRTERAVELLERHTAHVFVTVSAVVTEPSRVELLLRSIVAAVAALSPACGVCWGETPTFYRPEEFLTAGPGAPRSSMTA
jgi:hypothetical protein